VSFSSLTLVAAGGSFLCCTCLIVSASKSSVTASGCRMIMVQSQAGLSPVVNAFRSRAHHNPSKDPIL
jgi:hypothetical protein